MDHMKGWLRLLLAEIEAEFPDWEVSQAFRVFNVCDSGSNWVCNDDVIVDLERLAKTFDVSFDDLRLQFLRFRGRVAVEARTTQDNKTAWANVMRHVSDRNVATRSDDRLEICALSAVVFRYLAWGFSTSGIEQGFTRSMRSFSVFQEASKPEYEDRMVRLALEGPSNRPRELAQRARLLWPAMGFGNARTTSARSKRSDAGVKRSGRSCSEASFLKRRRDSVGSATGGLEREAAVDQVESSALPSCWGDSHEKELEFTRGKTAVRIIQASREGALRDAEDDDVFRDAARDQLVRMRDSQLQRERAASSATSRAMGCVDATGPDSPTVFIQAPTLRGKKLFSEISDVLNAREIARARGMVLTSVASEADFLLVDDPWDIVARSLCQWAAVLRGVPIVARSIIDATCVGNSAPVALVHKAGLQKRRQFYISLGFCRKHRRIAKFIRRCIECGGHKWFRLYIPCVRLACLLRLGNPEILQAGVSHSFGV